MTAVVVSLSEWLLEQYAVDVTDACTMAGLNPDGSDNWSADTDGYAVSERMVRVARLVLADVEAKRRIVEEHHPVKPVFGKPCCGICGDGGGTDCATLCLLALPYADRPGYRQEWRP